tara:strand:+ start:6223 stop:6462 length:240 start_codon:yes stop_codon:yes gene_type:complete
MIGTGVIVDKVLKLVVKQFQKQFKLDKVLDYVEKPNEADDRIDKLELTVFHQGKLISQLLEERDFALCEKCKKQIKEND